MFSMWLVSLFIKVTFLVLVITFGLNIVSRLAAPFLPARQSTAYLASVIPGSGAGPAPPGRPGMVGGPPAGYALPALEPPDLAKATPAEQTAARTLTRPVGRLEGQSLELRREGERTYLVAALTWTGDVRADTTWIGISATYSALSIEGQDLPPVRFEGAADLDGILRDLAANKALNLHDARRAVALAPTGRTTPDAPKLIRFFFRLPTPLPELRPEGWYQMRITFWTSDSFNPTHWKQLGWGRGDRTFGKQVRDAAWLVEYSDTTVPAPGTIALTGSLWLPYASPAEPVRPEVGSATKAPAQETKQGQSPSPLKGKP